MLPDSVKMLLAVESSDKANKMPGDPLPVPCRRVATNLNLKRRGDLGSGCQAYSLYAEPSKAKEWAGGNASKALTKGHDYSLPKVSSSLLAMEADSGTLCRSWFQMRAS
jgi:hypothetical protein